MTDEKRKKGVAATLLMPVVATVASGVASYLAKKGPQLLEETVLPKLRDGKSAARGVVASDGGDESKRNDDGDDDVSNDDLERRRRERAEHRESRRKAS